MVLALVGGALAAPVRALMNGGFEETDNIKAIGVMKRTAAADHIVAAAELIKRGDFMAAEEAIRHGIEIERRQVTPPDPTRFVFFKSY